MNTTELTPAENLLRKIVDRTSAYHPSLKHEVGSTILRLQHKESGESGVIFRRKPHHHNSIHITPSTRLSE